MTALPTYFTQSRSIAGPLSISTPSAIWVEFVPAGSVTWQRLPTDPIGTATVTFSGVQSGSEIRIYLQNMTEISGVENCIENPTLSWPVYAAGSPNNNVYITIIKRGLRWQRFNYTSSIGTKEIPIFQQPDLGYNNPV